MPSLSFLRAVPDVVWVLAALLLVCGAGFLWGEHHARAQNVAVLRRADSLAVIALVERSNSLVHRAAADSARDLAALAQRRADVLALQYTGAKTRTEDAVRRAASAREAIPDSIVQGLPQSVQDALVAGDSLRLAVTPALERADSTIGALQLEVGWLHTVIDQQRAAIAAQDSAYDAKVREAAELRKLAAPPACGWKCGATIGAGITAVVSWVLRR